MAAFQTLKYSHRIALLGGVSLVALAACSSKAADPAKTYEPAVQTPPPAVAEGSVSQEYKPVDGNTITTAAIGEEDGSNYLSQPGSVTTLAVGEEDGSGPIPVEPDGGIGDGAGSPSYATTLAVGEEDGSGPIPVEPDNGIGDGAAPPPFATTFAVGEEDGQYATPVDTGMATTLAIGEEDGSMPMPVEPDGSIGDGAGPIPGTATTLALGEEDGGYIAPNDPGIVTTLAIGEEDGSMPMPVEPDGGIGDGAGPIPGLDGSGVMPYQPPATDVTTLAVGEEG